MRTIMKLSVFGALVLSTATAHAEGDSRGGDRASRMLDRMCSSTANTSKASDAADRLAQRLSLNDKQKGMLKDLSDARQKARDDAKTALCAQRPDTSNMLSKFDFWTRMLDARVTAMKAVRPKLEAFYNALDDKQKASFGDAVRDMWMARHMRGGDDRGDRYGRSDDRDDHWSRDDDRGESSRRYGRHWGDRYDDDRMGDDREGYRDRYFGGRGRDNERGGWRDRDWGRRDEGRDRSWRDRGPQRDDDDDWE